jgi:hypothetical protein
LSTVPPPTDAELDVLARTYWALLGIDISVPPVDDPTAVVDQTRCLSSARSTLRGEVPITEYAGLEQRILSVIAAYQALTDFHRRRPPDPTVAAPTAAGALARTTAVYTIDADAQRPDEARRGPTRPDGARRGLTEPEQARPPARRDLGTDRPS